MKRGGSRNKFNKKHLYRHKKAKMLLLIQKKIKAELILKVGIDEWVIP